MAKRSFDDIIFGSQNLTYVQFKDFVKIKLESANYTLNNSTMQNEIDYSAGLIEAYTKVLEWIEKQVE